MSRILNIALSAEFIKEHRGCYGLYEVEECSFIHLELITVSDILYSEIPLGDKIWFIATNILTLEQFRELTLKIIDRLHSPTSIINKDTKTLKNYWRSIEFLTNTFPKSRSTEIRSFTHDVAKSEGTKLKSYIDKQIACCVPSTLLFSYWYNLIRIIVNNAESATALELELVWFRDLLVNLS